MSPRTGHDEMMDPESVTEPPPLRRLLEPLEACQGAPIRILPGT